MIKNQELFIPCCLKKENTRSYGAGTKLMYEGTVGNPSKLVHKVICTD